MRQPIFTIGHSTRPIDEFVQVLRSHDIGRLLDVRTVPRSRFNPQFDVTRLPALLQDAAIQYMHVPELGGLRKPRADSPNIGWRNLSFRGYADHMQTDVFKQGLDRCLDLALRERPALMCAEAVPWRCHRSLIADALVARGVEVLEITGNARSRPHTLTSFARVEGTTVTYPALEDRGRNAQLPLES